MTETKIQRLAMPPALVAAPIVAVLRARHASEYAPVIAALLAGGITSIELTLSTAGVFDELAALREAFGSEAEIGIGTVTTDAQARQALDAGTAFIVTPIARASIVRACVERGVPVYPGGLSPTELYDGWDAGATAVKIFPASKVGPGYLGQLRGPFPALRAIPSGGIDPDSAVAWIRAGAAAVSVGGPLLGDAFAGGDRAALSARAAELRTRVVDAAQARSGATS